MAGPGSSARIPAHGTARAKMKPPRPPPPALFDLPTCQLGIHTNSHGEITDIVFLTPGTPLATERTSLDELFCEAVSRWLNESDFVPALPFAARGTPFQQRVWQQIRKIPRGRTSHYGELAARLDSAARAVGQACGSNPFPLFTPCHRVLGKNSSGGFAHADSGWLIETKLWLLEHESD